MYSEWVSLQSQIQNDNSHHSVLKKYPAGVSKEIVAAVIKTLSQGLSSNNNDQASRFTDESEVDWTLEVLCYGLTLPFTEHELLKDCVNVYCDWFSCLLRPKLCVPQPIIEKIIQYSVRMLGHLYNLFVPRNKASTDLVNKQVVLCHRTLRTIETITKESQVLDRQFWECCLRFLLAVTDTLLAPPREPDTISGEMAERVIGVLFEIWLLACSQSFPVPSLWRTFRDMCSNWRHYEQVVIQWHRVVISLTEPVLKHLYGDAHPAPMIGSADRTYVKQLQDDMIGRLNDESMIQCWFRFLHILSNPVDLCRLEIISETPKFLHHALTSEKVIEPHQHPCLHQLPQIFYRGIKTIAYLTDAYLGCCVALEDDNAIFPLHKRSLPVAGPTPPPSTKSSQKSSAVLSPPTTKAASPNKSPVTAPAAPSIPLLSAQQSVFSKDRAAVAITRPPVNSILHLLGAWLFEASLCHVESTGRRPGSVSHRAGSLNDPAEQFQRGDFSQGRAEACAALARLFCSKKTGEKIQAVYLARFFMSMYHALSLVSPIKGRVLTYTLYHMTDLFRIDLPSINVLIPRVLPALEAVLASENHAFSPHEQVTEVDLRRSCIQILNCILCLPLHFGPLELKDLYTNSVLFTYNSLKSRISKLIINALSLEKDRENTIMLMGALVTLLLDYSTHEYRESEFSDASSIRSADQYNLTTAAEQADIVNQSDRCNQTSQICEPGEATPGVILRRPTLNATDDFNSAGGFLKIAASQICNSLILRWKSDHLLALSALEILTSLAKVKLQITSTSMCKTITMKICSLISSLCNRPPKNHNRDLHSLIVAAFSCLAHWVLEHSYVLQDKECLYAVLEVIELGISGKKSQQSYSLENSLMKNSKEHRPVSLRVKDAAEALLMSITDQLDTFPNACGAETLYPQLREQDFIDQTGSGSFTYFALNSNTIIAIMDQQNDESRVSCKVPVILRGVYGRQAWILEPRYQSTSLPPNQPSKIKQELAPEAVLNPRKQQRWWPASADKVPTVKADTTIPTLDDLEPLDTDFDNILKQYMAELPELSTPVITPECTAPQSTGEFETARAVLTQLGLLGTYHSSSPTNPSPSPPMCKLDSNADGFVEYMKALDGTPSRTCDTAYVFYVRSGQCQVADILDNTKSYKGQNEGYRDFLQSLGWPVNTHTHPGWNGLTFGNSYDRNVLERRDELHDMIESNYGSAAFDGTKWVLYWADARSEIAFIVPTEERADMIRRIRGDKPESSASANTNEDEVPPISSPKDKKNQTSELKIIIVWLERIEDRDNVPTASLMNICCTNKEHPLNTEHVIIYITALENGLLRIHTNISAERCSSALPLVDGSVVSRRIVGLLVRQTALNLCNRKRLLSELSQIPHNKRQQKIQDLITQYQINTSESQFYQQLFTTQKHSSKPRSLLHQTPVKQQEQPKLLPTPTIQKVDTREGVEV